MKIENKVTVEMALKLLKDPPFKLTEAEAKEYYFRLGWNYALSAKKFVEEFK